MSNITDYRLIGITGPTGAGKGAVGRILSAHGCAAVDADKIAHKALTLPECIEKLTEAFGTEILNSDGTINRKATAKAAFSTPENTARLNEITHPIILSLAEQEFESLASKGFRNIVFDAPTLFESGSDRLCHTIIAVVAPVTKRTERIMNRDGITQEQALARINAQKPDGFYTDRADFVIVNDSSEEELTERTEAVIKELCL